jgi:hypothetical protein
MAMNGGKQIITIEAMISRGYSTTNDVRSGGRNQDGCDVSPNGDPHDADLFVRFPASKAAALAQAILDVTNEM